MHRRASTGTHQEFGQVPELRPSWSEFQNFTQYLKKIAPQGKRYGIVKVIPPQGWTPRRTSSRPYDTTFNLPIPVPIEQVVNGQSGCFQAFNVEQPRMLVSQFADKANEVEREENVDGFSFDELERKFWKNIQFRPPLYGADMVGSLTDTDVAYWNLRSLPTILRLIDVPMEGINIPYLYFGMWKAFFAWHTEDMDLYSINYLHFGKAKRWYGIAPENGKRFEREAASLFPAEFRKCKGFLRHKTTVINPRLLTKRSIPVNTCVQEQGQFVITFPYAYHAGFNCGFNCAESINFAMPDWIEYGCKATRCTCSDTVRIDMNMFIARYQLSREQPDTPITEEMVLERIARNQAEQTDRKKKRPAQAIENQPASKRARHNSDLLENPETEDDVDSQDIEDDSLQSEWANDSNFAFSSEMITPLKLVITIQRKQQYSVASQESQSTIQTSPTPSTTAVTPRTMNSATSHYSQQNSVTSHYSQQISATSHSQQNSVTSQQSQSTTCQTQSTASVIPRTRNSHYLQQNSVTSHSQQNSVTSQQSQSTTQTYPTQSTASVIPRTMNAPAPTHTAPVQTSLFVPLQSHSRAQAFSPIQNTSARPPMPTAHRTPINPRPTMSTNPTSPALPMRTTPVIPVTTRHPAWYQYSFPADHSGPVATQMPAFVRPMQVTPTPSVGQRHPHVISPIPTHATPPSYIIPTNGMMSVIPPFASSTTPAIH